MKNMMVDLSRNDPAILHESECKVQKIRKWLSEKQYDALLLTRRENFFWITTGGDPIVVNSSEYGIACLAITPTRKILICHTMDAQRLVNEQIPAQEYEVAEFKWFEDDPASYALNNLKGRIACDRYMPGTDNRASDVTALHYPIAEIEMDRMRWLGNAMNKIYLDLGNFIQAGISEHELAIELRHRQLLSGIESDVTIAAGDERVFEYRHPMPTDKKIEKYILLHSAARKWGLHTPITRCYHIGPPTKALIESFRAAGLVQAATFASLKVDVSYKDIFQIQRLWYEKAGFPLEWQNHFQGGPTGYVIVESNYCLGSNKVKTNTAFEWFITLPGIKIAELSILTNDGLEIPSLQDGKWPTSVYKIDGIDIKVPDIFFL